jgi:hypothetical protein
MQLSAVLRRVARWDGGVCFVYIESNSEVVYCIRPFLEHEGRTGFRADLALLGWHCLLVPPCQCVAVLLGISLTRYY